jgi:hypothetical protein
MSDNSEMRGAEAPGYVTVPINPTPKMVAAGVAAVSGHPRPETVAATYRAMVIAAIGANAVGVEAEGCKP